ncbi:hypothetical protein C8J57DRAFT_1619771 [Mycena rebaudengoi]|nr:hypothetical protein C8J57DRAFT_1619771 [Mycena rebaudengoi]
MRAQVFLPRPSASCKASTDGTSSPTGPGAPPVTTPSWRPNAFPRLLASKLTNASSTSTMTRTGVFPASASFLRTVPALLSATVLDHATHRLPSDPRDPSTEAVNCHTRRRLRPPAPLVERGREVWKCHGSRLIRPTPPLPPSTAPTLAYRAVVLEAHAPSRMTCLSAAPTHTHAGTSRSLPRLGARRLAELHDDRDAFDAAPYDAQRPGSADVPPFAAIRICAARLVSKHLSRVLDAEMPHGVRAGRSRRARGAMGTWHARGEYSRKRVRLRVKQARRLFDGDDLLVLIRSRQTRRMSQVCRVCFGATARKRRWRGTEYRAVVQVHPVHCGKIIGCSPPFVILFPGLVAFRSLAIASSIAPAGRLILPSLPSPSPPMSMPTTLYADNFLARWVTTSWFLPVWWDNF